MHDTVIRGGTIVDGNGGAPYTGDVAIDAGRISAVGGKAGSGRREVDADGLLVTPGWVDVHTHYDGQATWDPILAPSSWHGVTTAMFGNCGVGFAPVRKADHKELIDLMEAIEEIPGTALEEGVRYDWESFPEFLDALERQPARSTWRHRCRTIRCASTSWASAPSGASRRRRRTSRRCASLRAKPWPRAPSGSRRRAPTRTRR